MYIKSILVSLFILSGFVANARESLANEDKLLIDYKYLYTYSKDSLAKFYTKREIPQDITPIRYDVDMYEITYWGKWVDDSYVKAKGVLMVPKTEDIIPEMSYCHGTRVEINEQRGLDDPEQMVTILHAADGYLAYFPFYYGLGGGEGRHIYQHAETEGLSVIYMIKSVRNELLDKIGVKTDGQLFVSGYSQGGHSAMATHKLIESEQFNDINITASAPLAGAFDMTGVQAETMFREYSSPYFLPYLIVSYKDVYPDIYPGDIYNVFRSPFRSHIKDFFEGNSSAKKDYKKLNKQLPKVASEMIVDSLQETFKTGKNPMMVKMAENNLYNWTPKAPTYLCACDGDNVVLPENTELTYETMKSNGAEVYLRTFGKRLAHTPCAGFAIMYSKIFFDNIRAGKKRIAKIPFKKRLMLNIGVMGANKKAKRKEKELKKSENSNDTLQLKE